MKYNEIDLNHYPRKDHFIYFKDLAYPYVGTTVNINITKFAAKIKESNAPFFLSFLYEAANAANAVAELRHRIIDNHIVAYSSCPTSHTVMRDNETFAYCHLNCDLPFDHFLPYAKKQQEQAAKEGNIEDNEDVLSYFFVSSLPWFSYTSLIQPTPVPADSNPRITWGKYFRENEKLLMPVSLLANHALVDGLHIAKFYEILSDRLNK